MGFELSDQLVERLLQGRDPTRHQARLRTAAATAWRWWNAVLGRPVGVAPMSDEWLKEHERTAAQHPDVA